MKTETKKVKAFVFLVSSLSVAALSVLFAASFLFASTLPSLLSAGCGLCAAGFIAMSSLVISRTKDRAEFFSLIPNALNNSDIDSGFMNAVSPRYTGIANKLFFWYAFSLSSKKEEYKNTVKRIKLLRLRLDKK